MRPLERFQAKPKSFWACVRSLSQHHGYSKRGVILTPDPHQMASAFRDLGLDDASLVSAGAPTPLACELEAYFRARAEVLTQFVEPRLMDAARARQVFEEHRGRLCPTCPLPMNKQKGEKRAEAFLTGLVNMIVQQNAPGASVNFDPRELTTITRDGAPIRTLARRVDGAFPSTVNPIAIWEVKEYYYTTTFGSRVADGVYETLLDGMELESLREDTGIEVEHLLIIDAHFTWWKCGKPYLCRIFDMLHMGYVSEVLFGFEVVERLPEIVRNWLAKLATVSGPRGSSA